MNIHLPELPLNAWEQTKMTLHLYLQIIGKIRLALMPRKNHWWYITEYISTQGITTHGIPYEDGLHSFEINVNLIQHKLEIVTSKGEVESFELKDGLSVASFYQQLTDSLNKLGIQFTILAKPFDLPVEKEFSAIEEFHSYDRTYVEKFWTILRWVDDVMKEFSGRFYGKTCPVHLYWHHMDLAVTRFSGKKGPAMDPASRISDKDAYSHEVISFGFWAGDDTVTAPAFYAYAYPSPEGLDQEPISPSYAKWVDSNGSPMAMLMYDELRESTDPRKDLLDFMETVYQAGAKLANWDVEGMTVPQLTEL
ncbi:MAG: DUF5996 family protein [Bacteroidota bacterium]